MTTLEVVNQQTTLEVLNPCGAVRSSKSFAPRLGDLNGKRIGMLSNMLGEADRTFGAIREALQKRFLTAEILPPSEFPQGGDRIDSEGIVEIVRGKGCDAVITGNAQCGSCSTKAARAAARLERVGIPMFVVTRKGFLTIIKSAFGGLGLPLDSPAGMEFPNEMFWPGSDLSPIEKNVDSIVFGLTKWETKVAPAKAEGLPPIKIEGKDYQDAIENMNLLFLRNNWSDGLPLVPATRERVDWILEGADLPRSKVLGTMLPKASIVTVEHVAVSLAMAGGRPEYLPVLIAAMEAFLDPATKHEHLQTTTGNNFPVVVVNGPVAKQIRLSSGFGCCGPDPNHPAGGSIGRALRLIQMNLGGAIPGIGTMSEYGSNRATNMVLAENEAGIPESWQPLNEERGFPKGSNTITMHFVTATIGMVPSTTTTEEAALHTLNRWSSYIGCPYNMYWGFESRWEHGSPGVVLMAPLTAQGLAAAGFSKDKVREYLWEKAKISPEKIKEFGFERHVKNMGADLNQPFPVSRTPYSLMIAIAGGASSGHALFLPNQGYTPVTKEVRLPDGEHWAALMQKAEADLGPVPAE